MKYGLKVAAAVLLVLLLSSASLLAQQNTEETDKHLKGIWWNKQRVIKQLQLTQEQRQHMNALLIAHLDWAGKQQSQKELKGSLHQALAIGDWGSAQRISGQMSTQAAQSTRRQIELKIDVLALLSNEQRQIVSEQLPRILKQPWLKGKKAKKRERTRANKG
jgi:Spy/CpxP family protein refolding chaperone